MNKTKDNQRDQYGGQASCLSRRSGFQPDLFSAGETPTGRDRLEARPPLIIRLKALDLYISEMRPTERKGSQLS